MFCSGVVFGFCDRIGKLVLTHVATKPKYHT